MKRWMVWISVASWFVAGAAHAQPLGGWQPAAPAALPPAAPAPSMPLSIVTRGAMPEEDPPPAKETMARPPAEVPTTALPPGPPPLTLLYLEGVAVKVNPVLVRDLARIDSAAGSAVQAGLMPNPRFDTNNPQVFNGRNTLLNAGFQQEIPVAGKKRLDQAAANENTRQAEITYQQDRFSLLANVRQQFYVVLAGQQRVKVLTELVDLVRLSHETAVKRKQAGDASQTDVLLLKIDLDRTTALLGSAEALLAGDRKQLEAIIGAPGLICGDVVGVLAGNYPEFDECKLIEFITTHNMQVVYAESVMEQTRVQLRRAEVEPYPNPTLGPAYQYGLVPGNDQFWFNITFNIPVWDKNQGNIRAAKANITAAQGSLDVTRLNLVNQAANLLSQYRAARAIVERYEADILSNAREAARLVREGYSKGIIDLGTFLQAQRTVIQANSDYLDALQNLWNNATQLSGMLQLEHFP